jgi:hypothetical protein
MVHQKEDSDNGSGKKDKVVPGNGNDIPVTGRGGP